MNNIDLEALAKALQETLGIAILTSPAKQQIKDFIQNRNFDVFTPEILKELSLISEHIIAPEYEYFSNGKYLPNIFVRLED